MEAAASPKTSTHIYQSTGLNVHAQCSLVHTLYSSCRSGADIDAYIGLCSWYEWVRNLLHFELKLRKAYKHWSCHLFLIILVIMTSEVQLSQKLAGGTHKLSAHTIITLL